MSSADLLLLVALAACVVLVMKTRARLFPIIALAGCALEALRAFGFLSIKIPVVGAALLFGAAIVVGGAGAWVKATHKIPVTAATVVVVVGLLRVLPALAGLG